MKVNITVDLDWLGEDGNIDELMQDEIIGGVKKAISIQCLERVEKQASKAIESAIDEAVDAATGMINSRVTSFVNEWLSNEVVVTNKYGEEVRRGSIKEIIRNQFDEVLNATVNSDGQIVKQGSYGAKTSVVRFLTGEAVKEIVSDELLSYKEDIDSKIKTAINSGIKQNVSDLFAQMVVNTARERHAEKNALPNG